MLLLSKTKQINIKVIKIDRKNRKTRIKRKKKFCVLRNSMRNSSATVDIILLRSSICTKMWDKRSHMDGIGISGQKWHNRRWENGKIPQGKKGEIWKDGKEREEDYDRECG